MNRREFLRATLASGLLAQIACEADSGVQLAGRESSAFDPTGLTRLARFAHVTDSHLIDDESPARFAAGQIITRSAWRPWEAYSAQIFDGMIRSVNRIHASGRTVDFLLHTGDGCDNAQYNELEWLLGVLDGRMIDPLSGPDDREATRRPIPVMDPYVPFQAAGLYREGVHGDAASIPWYGLSGNHDRYSVGVLAFFDQPFGGRVAPLPLQPRPGIVLPVVFNPVASMAHGNVTPAQPGPPEIFQMPRYIQPNTARAFFRGGDFVQAMFSTVTGPAGHGFAEPGGATWYSKSVAPGLRLIGLDTSDAAHALPGLIYSEGAISQRQVDFLRAELAAARQQGEIVVIATHHPSGSLQEILGSALAPDAFRALLNEHPQVVLHVCGHRHRNRVFDRGGYLEIETCATIDLPMESRLIELYRNETTGEVSIAYEMFSHVDDTLPALGDDPLRELRMQARSIAEGDFGAAARQRLFDGESGGAAGAPTDRSHAWRLSERRV